MPSVYPLTVTMTGAAGNRSYDMPKTSPPYQFLNFVNMTDNTVYLCNPQGQSIADAIYTFGPYATLSVPITAEIQFSFQIFWTANTDLSLIKKAQISFTYESLGYNQCYADSFAYSSGSLVMSITGNPTVNANIQGIANVNIANTPNVAISSGNVSANITNAQINTNLLNSLIQVGPLVQSTIVTKTINLNVGESITLDAVVPYCLGDMIISRFSSSGNKLNNYQFNLLLIHTGDLITVSDGTTKYLNKILTEQEFFNGFDVLFKPVYINPATLMQNIRFLITCINNPIVNDTLRAKVYCRHASTYAANPSSDPGNMIFGQGSYDASTYVNVTKTTTGDTLLKATGGYISEISLSIENFDTIVHTMFLKNGSNIFYVAKPIAGEMVQIDKKYGTGIANNGIYLGSLDALPKFQANGIISSSTQTPRGRSTTIV